MSTMRTKGDSRAVLLSTVPTTMSTPNLDLLYQVRGNALLLLGSIAREYVTTHSYATLRVLSSLRRTETQSQPNRFHTRIPQCMVSYR